jgi:hypothetical protein
MKPLAVCNFILRLTLSVFSANSQISVPGSEHLLDQLRLHDTFDDRKRSYSKITGDPTYLDFYPGNWF